MTFFLVLGDDGKLFDALDAANPEGDPRDDPGGDPGGELGGDPGGDSGGLGGPKSKFSWIPSHLLGHLLGQSHLRFASRRSETLILEK